jgi:peroxiredoxin
LASALILLALGGLAQAQLAPGEKAPNFTLLDTSGQEHELQQYLNDGKTVVLEWFNPDCPFIKKHHSNARTMDDTFAKVEDHEVVWLAINSGAPGKQGAGLGRNKKAHEEYKMTFPILLDESGDVGRAYGAKTSPHMFVITSKGEVAYNGAIDDNPSPGTLGQTNYVLKALQAVMSGTPIGEPKTRPYGCSVKYGN